MITDRHGRHAHQAFMRRVEKQGSDFYEWVLDGLSWLGEHRLYFGARRFNTSEGPVHYVSAVHTVRVSTSGVAGPATRVPGTAGLDDPVLDPTRRRLAAVRLSSLQCTGIPGDVSTSSIVIINLDQDTRRDLVTVENRGSCPGPIANLAWSPQGGQVAFTRTYRHLTTQYLHDEVDLVAVDGSDGSTPRVAVRDDGEHDIISVAWQSPHRLWFIQQVWRAGHETPKVPPDLYSAAIRHGHGITREREPRAKHVPERTVSFG